jgi:iron-sulfur cluster assembly protein
MISLTQEAANQIRRMMADQSLDPSETGVRVAVAPSGCSGLSYQLDFAKAAKEGDQILEMQGLKVFLDAGSATYLQGTEIDWKGGLLGAGFQFRNPQAQRTCGCGESFNV